MAEKRVKINEKTRCRFHGCEARVTRFLCPTHSRKVSDQVERFTAEIYPDAREIYVGRSHFPEQRLLQHVANGTGRNHMTVLMWASSKEQAADYELKLIEDFSERGKGPDQGDKTDRHFAGNLNALYLNWSQKAESKWKGPDRALPLARVDGDLCLDDADRLFPEPLGVFKPVHLVCDLTPKQAKAVLDRYHGWS